MNDTIVCNRCEREVPLNSATTFISWDTYYGRRLLAYCQPCIDELKLEFIEHET